MAQIETWLNQDMMQAVKVRYLDGNLFSQDNAGNLIGVKLTRDGEDYSGGGTVSANVIRADGGTVAVTGALSGNVATVVLPQSAYAVPGVVSIVVKLTVSGAIITIAAVVANIYQSSTETAIDPGTIIPSIQTLINQINTAVASIPADYSSLWATLAPAFSTSTAYTIGQYVTYDGGLYRFTSAHPAGAWSASDATAAVVGGVLTDLQTGKADKTDPVFYGTISKGRKGNSQAGTGSVALGDNVTANGWFSQAEGQGTIANGSYQRASGKYNVADTGNTYAEMVGNGYAEVDQQTFVVTEHRSNARTLDWNGNETLAGDLTVNKGTANEVTLGSEVSNLKNEIQSNKMVKDSDAEDVDLDITDPNGNVIARFQNGDFQVKNFSTKKAIETSNEITDEDADFYITDGVGNGVIRLFDGQIQTSKFNTDQTEYKKTFSYTNVAGTETITRFFPKGTVIVCHLVNNAVGSDSIANNKVTYSYKDRNNVSHEIGQDYGYNFVRCILPSDAVSVTVTYSTGMLWGYSGTLAFSVYTEATFIKHPVIVSLDVNGGKDFTSLRDAVDAVAPYANEQTPYEIQIYPGTYNIMEDYTADEISASGFVGLMITNGISLVGIGQRDEIIISGVISSETYDSTKRNDMSTLNTQGNIRIENLTISATNIRYAIHDDYVSMTHKRNDHIYKNLKLTGTTLTTGEITFGAGGGNNRRLFVTDCDFEGTFLVHNSDNNVHPFQVYLENCSATKFSFPDYDAVTPTYVYLRNCKAMFIETSMIGTAHNQSLFIDGEGTCGAFVRCPAGYVYNTGDCRRIRAAQIATGYAVKAARVGFNNNYPHISITTDADSIYGISIGNDGENTIVQISGYINSATLGLADLAVGDYLTIDGNGAVVSGGTSANSIAKVVFVDENNTAYAKLTF